MDFLDPHKQRRHALLLYTGYVLIAIAILISTIVLVYQANGFGVNSKGQVVQNGLVFFSSQPNPATIYLNGQKNPAQTNTRLSLPSGRYSIRLARDGYRDWQRSMTVQGGDVQHFDYPLLFPKTLVTVNQATYASAPGLTTQSRDRRWLLVQQPGSVTTFDLYDLKNPKQPAVPLILPTTVMHASGAQAWELVQWADDNQHVLLKHSYGAASEFVLVDRQDAAKAVNLNLATKATPATVSLIDNKYDQFHLLDASGVLSSASLGNPTPVTVLQGVLSYKSYGTRTLLYATASGAPAGKVVIAMVVGDKTYTIRQAAADTTYTLDMTGYDGSPYVVVGAAAENVVYIYRDPVKQLQDPKVLAPVAIRALRLTNPSYVSFSPTAQYIVAESGSQFGVYDIFLKHAYVYTLANALDAPAAHASWMDGNRLSYVSDAKTFVVDYDRRNPQTLMPTLASYGPYYSPDYHYVYGFTSAASGVVLTQTALLASNDL